MEFGKVLCLCVLMAVVAAKNLEVPSSVPVKTTSDIVQVTPLPADSGLYFQYINKIKFIEDIWSFVIEMDHDKIFKELIQIFNTTVNLESYIDFNKDKIKDCTNVQMLKLLISPLKNRISLLVNTHNLIDQKVQKTPKGTKLESVSLSRKRRGILDPIGRIDKFLFGVMDADDAHELHVLANTSNALNSQVAQLTDELIKLTDYVEHKSMIQSEKIARALDMCGLVNAKISMICSQINDIEDLYLKLDRAVDSAKLNHLNSLVLTPERLLTEMRKVQDSMGTFFWPVPSPLTLESMHGLIDTVVNTHVFVTHERKLLFIIEVPLVEARTYDLYHTVPLPFCDKKEKCAIVLPDSKYLGISSDLRTFVRLDDLKSCKLTEDGYLCYSSTPESESSLARMCDVRIFLKNDKNVNVTNDCDVRLGRFEDVLFYPIADYNNWLYVMQHDTNINIQCHKSPSIPANHKFDPITVSTGVGIIRAVGQETCKLSYKYGTLPIHQLKTSLNSSIVVKVNLGGTVNLTNIFDRIDSIELESSKMNVNLEHSKLREMTVRLEDLRRRISNNTVFSGDDVTDNTESQWLSNWFSGNGLFHTLKIISIFFVCAIFCSILGGLIYCCCVSCSTFRSCCKFNKKNRNTKVRRYSIEDRVMHDIPTMKKKKRGAAKDYVDDGEEEETMFNY